MDIVSSQPHQIFSSYPVELNDEVLKISTSPYFQPLLGGVQEVVGNISVKVEDCNGFQAAWNPKTSTIYLSPKTSCWTQVDRIANLTYELCNAVKTPLFKRIVKEVTDIEEFVIQTEALEYDSGQKTRMLISQSFGDRVEYDLKHSSSNFYEHLAYQYVTGHAQALAKPYYPNQPLQGALAHPLSELGPQGTKYLRWLLGSKMHPQGLQLKNGRSITFDQVMTSLKRREEKDPICKKVLQCAELLFRPA